MSNPQVSWRLCLLLQVVFRDLQPSGRKVALLLPSLGNKNNSPSHWTSRLDLTRSYWLFLLPVRSEAGPAQRGAIGLGGTSALVRSDWCWERREKNVTICCFFSRWAFSHNSNCAFLCMHDLRSFQIILEASQNADGGLTVLQHQMHDFVGPRRSSG